MANEVVAIPNCLVQLEGRTHHIEGNTDTHGRLTLQKIPDDTYTLMVLKEGYETYIHKEPILIKENKINHTNLQVSLARNSRTIQVNVTPNIKDINITLTNDNQTTPITAKTDTNGIAIINNVLYGTYTLTINKTGYDEYTQNISINKNNNEPRIIEITLQETNNEDS